MRVFGLLEQLFGCFVIVGYSFPEERSRASNQGVFLIFTVKRIIPQKNHSTSTRSPVQTQERVYELSRSPKNGVSFKEKAKRTTSKNKTNRKKQKKSNSWLRGYRKIVQTRKDDLLFLVIERRKRICNSQSKD